MLPKSRTKKTVERQAAVVEQVELPMDMGPGLFYRFNKAHWSFNAPVLSGQKLDVHELGLDCSFTVHQVRQGKKVLGYRFSGRGIENGGAYLLLSNGVPATSWRLVSKSPALVIYEFPGSGALAILPHVGERVEAFIQDQ